MAKRWRHVVTVKPLRNEVVFAIDMLRWDGLYPASERDSAKIGFTMRYTEDFSKAYPDNYIVLNSFDRPKGWRPTEDRWTSFGWYVLTHKVFEY